VVVVTPVVGGRDLSSRTDAITVVKDRRLGKPINLQLQCSDVEAYCARKREVCREPEEGKIACPFVLYSEGGDVSAGDNMPGV